MLVFASKESDTVYMEKSVMDVTEIAGYLGFSVRKIYELIKNKQIPASKIGGQYRFVKGNIDRWLQEATIVPLKNKRG